MALKTLVKVSEVNNLSDARYCAGMGVEMIGFPLDESHPKFIDLAKLREISVWIAGIKVVGEFTGENVQNMNYLAKELNLDFIQLNHTISPGLVKELKKPVIQKLDFDLKNSEETKKLLQIYKDNVSYFLLENNSRDTVEGCEAILTSWVKQYPIILGFGISDGNVEKIIEEIRPAGIGLKEAMRSNQD
jgi:phosphoribosylanthranilate isomerase